MLRLAPGISLLVIVSALIFFGLAERVLDRMRLTDRSALILLLFMVGGYYLPEVPSQEAFASMAAHPIGGHLLDCHQRQLHRKARGIAATLG